MLYFLFLFVLFLEKCGDKFCVINVECIDNRICICLNGFFGIGDI